MQRPSSPIEPFSDFYDANASRVLLWLSRACGDPETGMDLTAEAFAQAFVSRGRFRGKTEASARSWLNTIAVRQLNLYLRRGYAERQAMDRLRLERPVLSEAEQRLLSGAISDAGDRGDVQQALESVSADLRAAAELRVVDDLPYSEIAERLAITETAARMRVSRALQAMRIHLDPEFERGPL